MRRLTIGRARRRWWFVGFVGTPVGFSSATGLVLDRRLQPAIARMAARPDDVLVNNLDFLAFQISATSAVRSFGGE